MLAVNQENETNASRGTADSGVANRGVAVPAFSLIEIRPTERKIVFTLASGAKHFVSLGTEPGSLPITQDQLPPGDYRCLVHPDGKLEIADNYTVMFKTYGFEAFPPEVRKAFDDSKREVRCKVVWDIVTDAARNKTQEKQQAAPGPTANRQFPVKGDLETLRMNARLRAFVWELINHFANSPDKPPTQVTYEDIQALITKDANAREIAVRTIQAWDEFQRARSKDYSIFERLSETLIEQWSFGNATVRLNRLALLDAPDGWGLYHRDNGIKYYDEFGVPIESFMGTTWEKHYKWVDKSKSTPLLPISISPDDPIFHLTEAFRAGGIPHPEMIEAAAKGYFENGKLLGEEIENNPGKWENVQKILREQTPLLAIFLGVEGLATFLEIQPHWVPKGIGRVLKLLLKASAYFFNISFAGNATKVVLEIGAALYRIKRNKDGKPDRLSQRHLTEAADLARELLEELAALVAVLSAAQTAKVIAEVMSSGGTVGPKPQLAPATVRGTSPGAVAVPAAPASTRIPPGIVLMAMGEKKSIKDRKTEQEKEARRAEAEQRERSNSKNREAAERAKREGEKEWQAVEKELSEFLASTQKAPDELRYSGKQASTVFENLFKELESRAKNKGDLARVREARSRGEKLFNETKTIDKLLDDAGLKRAFEKYQKYFERRRIRAMDRLRETEMNKEQNPADYQIARDEIKYGEVLAAQLRRFREGLISLRKFDGVQVFMQSSKVAITDATMRVGEPFHQMKSIIYREIWQKIFPDFKIEVWEYKSPTIVYEIKPTQDFARDLERAVDLKLAQEGTNL